MEYNNTNPGKQRYLSRSNIKYGHRKLSLLTIGVMILFALTLCSCGNSRYDQSSATQENTDVLEPSELLPGEAEILGIADDKGVDYIDDKRGFEYLQVDIKVNTGKEGQYGIHAYLLTEDDELISAGNLRLGAGIDHAALAISSKLPKGVSTVPVYFGGGNIREMKINGPYKVHIVLSGEGSKVIQQADFYTINSYKYRKFAKW